MGNTVGFRLTTLVVLFITLQSIKANEMDPNQFGSVRVPHRYGKRNFDMYVPSADIIADISKADSGNQNDVSGNLNNNEDVVRKKIFNSRNSCIDQCLYTNYYGK